MLCVSTTPMLLHNNAPGSRGIGFKGGFERLWIRGIVTPTLDSPDLAPCDFYLFPNLKKKGEENPPS